MKKLMLVAVGAFSGLAAQAAGTLPVTDGLTVWLDASDVNNVVTNGAGQVTNWINRAENGLDFTVDNKYPAYTAPVYSLSGLAGRNCVMFGVSTNGEKNVYTMLATASKLKSQTIFIVAAILSDQWTRQGVAYGIRGGNNANAGLSRDYTVTYLRWIRNGFGGQGWLNGNKWLDEANGLGVASTYATPTAGASHLITAVRTTAWDDRMAVGEGNTGQHYDWYGPIGEIVVFDRKLPPYERVKIENYLLAKWVGATARVWKGGTGDWNVAANWEPEGVPEPTDLVDIPAGGNVTVDSTASAAALTVEGSLTIAENAVLSILRGGLGADASITMKNGSCLAVSADFSGAASGVQTFSYEGAVSINQTSYYGTFALPSVVHAGARLVKRGLGRLVFTADGPASGAYDIQCGTSAIDFAGTHQKFTSLIGATFATNLVQSALARLEMDVADRGTLDMELPKEMSFEKKGLGVLEVSGGSLLNTGRTEVVAGALRAAEAALPRTIPGLVVHIDASDASTYELPAGGYQLAAVRSKTGMGMSAGHRNDSGNWDWPYLAGSAINGKPAFAFGTAASSLGFSKKACNINFTPATRTIVAVVMTTETPAYSAVPTLSGRYAKQTQAVAISGKDCKWDLEQFAAYGENKAHGYCSVNGLIHYDYDNGITDTVRVPAQIGNVQVLVMTSSDSCGALAQEVGNNVTGVNRRWSGYLGEMMFFNRPLDPGERMRLENYLMAKWGVTSSVTNSTADTLSPSAPITFAAGTTLDLGGMTQTVEKVVAQGALTVTNGTFAAQALEVVCSPEGAWGSIEGDANWDVTGTALAFSGLGVGKEPAFGKLVTTTGICAGPFDGVSGLDPDQVKVKSHCVQLGKSGLTLLVR